MDVKEVGPLKADLQELILLNCTVLEKAPRGLGLLRDPTVIGRDQPRCSLGRDDAS